MGIKHIKFDSIDSTQSWAKDNISKYLNDDLLVSSCLQTNGIGRHGNNWVHLGDSLAFSFTLRPCSVLTLTPLEIGVLVAAFFKQYNQEVLLKWPNDLLINEKDVLKKVGGIICHYQDAHSLIFGIGINLNLNNLNNDSNFKIQAGAIKTNLVNESEFNHAIPMMIYEYILERRISIKNITKFWINSCAHIDKQVMVIDGKNKVNGHFLELGENGEALISTQSGIKKFISGSLWISN